MSPCSEKRLLLQKGCRSLGDFSGEVLLPFLTALPLVVIPKLPAVRRFSSGFSVTELSSHSQTASHRPFVSTVQ